MLTVEPYEEKVDNTTLTHRLNSWDYDSMNLVIDEILDFSVSKDLEAEFGKYSKHCKENKIQYTITRIDQKETLKRQFLEKQDFTNVESTYKISCRFEALKNTCRKNFKNKYFKKTCDIGSLQKLASTIFYHGRFAEDYLIDSDKSNQRYCNWVKTLYTSKVNRLFMFSKDKLIGFMFYEMQEGVCELKLGGMSPEYSHLAQNFWSNVFLSIGEGYKIKTSISAANLGVVNLYSNFGFRFEQLLLGYRKRWDFYEG